VHCTRCGKANPKMTRPPFRNAQGQLIFEKICAPCWKEWLGMGTKVINELRLPMNEPEAQKVYDRHMLEFLGLQ
jgi:Fe-S cluster biosynthesis and repair protein YggX